MFLYHFSVVFYFKLQSLLCIWFSYLLPLLKNSQTSNIRNVIHQWIVFLYKGSSGLGKISATQRQSLFLTRSTQQNNTRLRVLSVNPRVCSVTGSPWQYLPDTEGRLFYTEHKIMKCPMSPQDVVIWMFCRTY